MSDGLPKDDDLRSCIGVRLEQDGVHAGVRVDEGGLRLHDLGAAHFVARRGDPRVQRHVLRFEGGDAVAVLPEDAAVSRRKDALARVGGGALQHEGRGMAGAAGYAGGREEKPFWRRAFSSLPPGPHPSSS